MARFLLTGLVLVFGVSTIGAALDRGQLKRDQDSYLEAIRRHDVAGLDRLLDRVDSASTLSLLLQPAIERDDVAIVTLLIKRGANPNFGIDGPADTPLLNAARVGCWEITEILLRAGANPSGRAGLPNRAWFPLFAAVSNGHQRVVRLLLSAHADVNARLGLGSSGQVLPAAAGPTALMEAARRGDLEVLELLLKAGADPGVRDENGRRAVGLAGGT